MGGSPPAARSSPQIHAASSVVLMLLAVACSRGDALTARPSRNVVVYLIDTLRADRLGVYGYPRQTSPRIDAFARSGVVFDQAYSNSPWTRTSVVTLFTGLRPDGHGVHDEDDAAPDALQTMAEAFREAGWETAGFSSNVSVSRRFNLAQGFDEFTYFDPEIYFADRAGPNPGYVPVDGMLPAVAAWVERPHPRPFFLYVHATDPHVQYWPPPPYRRWGITPAALYDGEVALSDDYFGRFADLLARRGILEETLVVLTADHGEELGERGWFTHGHSLYNELLRVPLVMRHPALAPGRHGEIVHLLDLLPTLVEWLGLPVDPKGLQGRSLLPLLSGAGLPPDAPQLVIGKVRYPSKVVGASLQMDGYKLIHVVRDQTGKHDSWELYDLEHDAAERHDRAADLPDLVADYRQRLVALGAAVAKAPRPSVHAVLDPRTEDRLRALGYVD